MNRRIIIDPIGPDRRGRGLVGGAVTFVSVLAACALLSVDDVETEPERATPETHNPGWNGYEPPGFSDRQRRALQAAGFKDAKPGPYQWFGCSESDALLASAGFVVNGIHGNVCCGYLKGCVVRTQ